MNTSAKPNFASVVVIGAGQAGLSAGYHLQRSGFVAAAATGAPQPAALVTANAAVTANPAPAAPAAVPLSAAVTATSAAPGTPNATYPTFVILDAELGAGGAWRHRWQSLSVGTLNDIFDLPAYPKPHLDPAALSRTAVPGYFADFESAKSLPIIRPVNVLSVERADDRPDGELIVTTNSGTWRTRAIINASGTWNNPVLPRYPGQHLFRGRQLHTRDYTKLEDFTGQRVAIVGGGISAVQQLEEISRVAQVFWYTRREPVFRDEPFTPEIGSRVVAKVAADVAAGRPTGSVVSYTDLAWLPYAVAARDRGALQRRPMFSSIQAYGVREADGSITGIDSILWATGFKPALEHLAPLQLKNELGGIQMLGTQVASDARIHLIGFGPSQSTVGANRAGRDAVRELLSSLFR